MVQKVLLTFKPDVIETLRQRAEAEGIFTLSTYVRALIIRSLNKEIKQQDENNKIVEVPVKNYSELKAYAEAKRLGSVEVLATFAMDRYMLQYPLKTPLQRHDGRNIDNEQNG
jgi:hypothetical protein